MSGSNPGLCIWSKPHNPRARPPGRGGDKPGAERCRVCGKGKKPAVLWARRDGWWKPSENAPIRDGRHSTSLSGAFYARTVASVPLRATDVSSGAFAGVDNVDQALVIRPNAR